MKNHERFNHWREVVSAFSKEWIGTHPESRFMPQFVLDQAMLEWLYEDIKKTNMELTKANQLEEATASSCKYRTDRGTCGLLDKEDHTYTCCRENCTEVHK